MSTHNNWCLLRSGYSYPNCNPETSKLHDCSYRGISLEPLLALNEEDFSYSSQTITVTVSCYFLNCLFYAFYVQVCDIKSLIRIR